MHQTKYRGIITEAGSLTFPPWDPVDFPLVKPLRKSVSPFGGDLCFGWLGSPGLYLYKPLGCVSTSWKWMPAGKDKKCITKKYPRCLTASLTSQSGLMSGQTSPGCPSCSQTAPSPVNHSKSCTLIPVPGSLQWQK